MPTCKGCGAYIDFVMTVSGKAMPVNSEYVMVMLGGGRTNSTIITDDGKIVRGRIIARGAYLRGEKSNDAYAVGRVSHFATCPAANGFRKKVRA